MAITFPEGFISEGSFEREAMALAKKARTTETYHFRVIVNSEDPFKNPTDVTVVTNQLGARIAYEGERNYCDALVKFYAEFDYNSHEKTSPANIFYLLASASDDNPFLHNVDHPSIEYYVDPSLLEKAYYKVDRYSFFLVPLEKTDLLRVIEHSPCRSLNLSLSESSMLSNIPTMEEGFGSEIQSFRKYVAKNGNITSPSICLIAIDDARHGGPFPQVFIYAKPVRTEGYFPVLFGLKSVKENGQYLCVPGRKKVNFVGETDLVKHAVRKLGIHYMAADKKSVMDWKELLATLEFFKEGYEAGRDAAIRSRKADELAGD